MPLIQVADECQHDYQNPKHEGEPKYCHPCEAVYCDSCYEAQRIHSKQTERHKTHERTDLEVARFVLRLFNTYVPRIEDRQQQHEDAYPSKWFGVHLETPTKPSLHVFGALATLLKESQLPPFQHYPSLVSFVGDTGAGKSTLINGITKLVAFINKGETNTDSPQSEAIDTLSPVMGTTTDQCVPTSGDVHLFCDPVTRDTKYPMYYADCEGMNGGENVPIAEKCLGSKTLQRMRDLYVEKRRAMPPPITRGSAVKTLYPRILFPFSDVVCFVTRNARNFEKHLEKLLLWANKAIDMSTNQPLLPHAVIIINVFEPETSSDDDGFHDWWNHDKVTTEFLRLHQNLVDNDSSIIGQMANKWRNQSGREIKTLRHLIRCYYSDFKVICIPDMKNDKLSLTMTQYVELQKVLTRFSKQARGTRKRLGFLMSGETLERYFGMAFDHFAASPSKAFNFLSAALLRNPVTQTLKDHICNLAVQFMKVYPKKTGNEIFSELGMWVGSCIFLDSHRLDLPSNEVAEVMLKRYQHFCTTAQSEFYDQKWPCEAMDKYHNRCVNLKSTHDSKNHQNSEGKIFSATDPNYRLEFKSSFETPEDKKLAEESFLEAIKKSLERCIKTNYKKRTRAKETREDHITIREIAADIHMSTFETLRRTTCNGISVFVSHRSCCCCLTSIPAHKLFCGHVICQACLEDYSSKGDHFCCLVLRACPLCASNRGPSKFEIKPPTAGLRILCLDGGGIRSIMQLHILKYLLKLIDLDIPIERYFDLMVGTSGGGIIAAGIGLRQFDIDEAIGVFKRLANTAFIKRRGAEIPIIGHLVVARHHGLYKTLPLESTLKEVFRDTPIFGANLDRNQEIVRNLKVAVTMTSNRRSFLVGNYNRPSRQKLCIKKMENECVDLPIEEPWAIETGSEPGTGPNEVLNMNSERGVLPLKKNTSNIQLLQDDGSASREDEEDTHSIDTDMYSEDESKQHCEDVPRTSPSASEASDDRSVWDTDAESFEPSMIKVIESTDNSPDTGDYVFLRGDNIETELQVWEAARATSAAPGYFKSFLHPATKYAFDDGALKCNNPVFIADWERKAIWPNFSKQDPDIVLSIGTGFDPNPPAPATENSKPVPKRGVRSFAKKLWKIGSEAVLEDMNSELMWNDFIKSIGLEDIECEGFERYQRLNPHLKSPIPRLDAIDQLENLEQAVKEYVSKDTTKLTLISNMMVASLFYFDFCDAFMEVTQDTCTYHSKDANLTCKGRIKCRVGSVALSRKMETYRCRGGKSRALFLIGEKYRPIEEMEELKAEVSPGDGTRSPEKISYDVKFTLKNIHRYKEICIFLSLWGDYGKPICISGFPRLLSSEARSVHHRRSTRHESIRLPAQRERRKV